MMVKESAVKRTVAFIDGQNLFYGVKEAFGYTHPNYDVLALPKAICAMQGWDFVQARFYTGIPDMSDNKFWHVFWSKKLLAMSRQGVHIYSRSLRYRNKRVKLPGGTYATFLTGEEKGIDVRIALDIIRMAHRKEFDIALVFSEDQDLSEVSEEIRTISREQNRWIKMACAFPYSPTHKPRGINKTDWIRIDKTIYDSCIDTRDYRSKPKQSN
jgi:uncharacterized LabA/DUF88 family protein